MVPFVPLDNAVGIRRIQRRTIKKCFDFASTPLKLFYLPGEQTSRGLSKDSEEEVGGLQGGQPCPPDSGKQEDKGDGK